MNLLMTATPLAMDFCSLPYAQAATVISWHVVGMYAPGFVTGSLINRFGVLKMILAGIAVMAGGAAVALNGNDLAHFVVALVLIGVGWNFMYTGGTTLLTESYAPAEKARTQGANDSSCSPSWRSRHSRRRHGVRRRLGGHERRRAADPRVHRGRRDLVCASPRAAGAEDGLIERGLWAALSVRPSTGCRLSLSSPSSPAYSTRSEEPAGGTALALFGSRLLAELAVSDARGSKRGRAAEWGLTPLRSGSAPTPARPTSGS